MKEKTLKNLVSLYVFILLAWGFYRFLFRFPEEIEELVFKPLIWLVPTLLLIWKERGDFASLGLTSKNLAKSCLWGLGLGIVFAAEGLIIHFIKKEGFILDLQVPLNVLATCFLVSIATALSEETVFRGYIFRRLWEILGRELQANLISSLAWSLVHLPITIFVFNFNVAETIAFLVLNFVFGAASAFVFARTKNLLGSLLLHVLWSFPILLFG